MSNKAWQIASAGVLQQVDLGPPPAPGPREVLFRIHAVSLNHRDKLVVEHTPPYPLEAKPGLIPCCDAAGIVEETGSDSRWARGESVILSPHTWLYGSDDRDFTYKHLLGGGDKDGTLRQYMIVSDEHLVKCPKRMTMDEAATLWTAGVTAYRALYYDGIPPQKGTTVLTQGTGGVSCYAIALAAASGATVVATSSSDEKLEVARKLGATHVINYQKSADWDVKVLEATGGRGADRVVDTLGAGSIEKTIKCTARCGFIAILGLLSKDPQTPVNVNEILFGSKTLRGQIGTGSRKMAEELCRFVEKHDIHPPIADVFDLKDADKAIEALTKSSKPGKIVVRC